MDWNFDKYGSVIPPKNVSSKASAPVDIIRGRHGGCSAVSVKKETQLNAVKGQMKSDPQNVKNSKLAGAQSGDKECFSSSSHDSDEDKGSSDEASQVSHETNQEVGSSAGPSLVSSQSSHTTEKMVKKDQEYIPPKQYVIAPDKEDKQVHPRQDTMPVIDTSDELKIPNYQSQGQDLHSKRSQPSRCLADMMGFTSKVGSASLTEPLLDDHESAPQEAQSQEMSQPVPKDSQQHHSPTDQSPAKDKLKPAGSSRAKKSRISSKKAPIDSLFHGDKKSQILERLIDNESQGSSHLSCSSQIEQEGGEQDQPQIIESQQQGGDPKDKRKLKKTFSYNKEMTKDQIIAQVKEEAKDKQVPNCSCPLCEEKRHKITKVIDNSEKLRSKPKNESIDIFRGSEAWKEELPFNKDDPLNKRVKPEWGQILLVEDHYPSSESDEEKQVEKLLEIEKSNNILNYRLGQSDEDQISEWQKNYNKHIKKKYLDKQRDKKIDEEAMKEKRGLVMELFMDLDKNNDNFVDRKDLIKYYGMLKRIEGASVEPKYKCKRCEQPMKPIVYDQQYNLKDQVKLGFKPTNENKLANLIKFNGEKGEIAGEYKKGMKVMCEKEHKFEELTQNKYGKKIDCSGKDENKHCKKTIKKIGDKHLHCEECDLNYCEACMFDKKKDEQLVRINGAETKALKPHAFVRVGSELIPGEPVVCCHDKECDDDPVDLKQSFIFCPNCSTDVEEDGIGKNLTVCLQHASEYLDLKEMKDAERIRQEEHKKGEADRVKKMLDGMLLFLTMDFSDDGFLEQKEWDELFGLVVFKNDNEGQKVTLTRQLSKSKLNLSQASDAEHKEKVEKEAKRLLKKVAKTSSKKIEDEKVEQETTYDLNNEQDFQKIFKDELAQQQIQELGFLEFDKLIGQLNIDPKATRTKLINNRYKGCSSVLKCLYENSYTRNQRIKVATKKIQLECDNDDQTVRESFNDYFRESGENKMDMFDFYEIIENSEVDVKRSVDILYKQQYQGRCGTILCFKQCRRVRKSQAQKHVDTFDQIESEKHEFTKKSGLAEQDSLSKVILVYLQVIQFVDLLTDGKLFYDMYRYSRIPYVPCNENRIDFIVHDTDDFPDDSMPLCSILTEQENPSYFTSDIDVSSHDNIPEGFHRYTKQAEFSYKIATTVMGISMLSTYLIAYSSIIKLLLDNGSFEPHITKQNRLIVLIIKFIFLSFLGPICIMCIEAFSAFMAISQVFALLAVGYVGYDIIKNRFMYIFENVFMLDEERAEGLKQQRTIAQLFFENMPMMVVQTLIQFNYLKCEELKSGSAYVLYISYMTTCFSIFACALDIRLQATALDENTLIFCLNCLQARQGWIPFLHQISTNELKRDAYDYGRIVCSYPYFSVRSLYFKFFKFQFTDVSLNMLISELASMNLQLDRLQKVRQKLKIFIGRSTNLVTLETVLHVYQLVMQQPDIQINLDGINWGVLVANSKKKLLIPTINDKKKEQEGYMDQIQTTQIQNQVRINNIKNYQKIENYESRTPAGEYCLWICADDEKVKPEEEEKEEYHQWKHYARIKRIAVDAHKQPNMQVSEFSFSFALTFLHF